MGCPPRHWARGERARRGERGRAGGLPVPCGTASKAGACQGKGGEELPLPPKCIFGPSSMRVSGRRFRVGITHFYSPFPHLGSGAANVKPSSIASLRTCTGKEPTLGEAAPEADRSGRPCSLAGKSSVWFFKNPRHMGANFSALRQDKEPSDGTGWAGSAPRRLARRRAGLLSRLGAVGGYAFAPAPSGFCPLSSPRQLLSPRPPPDLVPSL